MSPPDPDKAAKVKLAVELAEQGYSLRYIGQKIGKSHTAVRKYIEEGKIEAEWAFMVDAAQDREALRAFLATLQDWLVEEREALGGKAVDYVPVILKVVEQRAKVVGTYAPKQVSVADLREPPRVDPVTEAQVDATLKDLDGA